MGIYKKKKYESLNFSESISFPIARLKKQLFVVRMILNVLMSTLVSLSLSILWFKFNPELVSAAIVVGVLTWVSFFYVMKESARRASQNKSFLLALDIKFPNAKSSVYNKKLWDELSFREEWDQKTESMFDEIKKLETKSILKSMSVLFFLFVISLGVMFWGGKDFYSRSKEFFVSYGHRGARIYVLNGSLDNQFKNPVLLNSKKTVDCNLAQTNIVVVELFLGEEGFSPVVELKKTVSDEGGLQSFQMSERKRNGLPVYYLQFSVTESSYLFIPEVSGRQPLVNFKVQESGVPKVSLKSSRRLPAQWQDDLPIDLIISVTAKNPLDHANLLIKVNEQKYTESIYTAAETDSYTLQMKHSLVLSKYVDEDVAKVELRVEAVDRNHPKPLVGYSQPLIVESISSYGIYTKILSELKSVKDDIDLSISKGKDSLNKDIENNISRLIGEVNHSPFFDATDRVFMMVLQQDLLSYLEKKDVTILYKMSQNLGEFLLEHEMMDNRERDRDFFVAARGLSYLLGKDRKAALFAEEKISKFLKDREIRWKMRVKRLWHPEKLRYAKQVIQDRYIHKKFDKIRENTEKSESKEAIKNLSALVSFYGQWIEDLEKVEDNEQKEQDQERSKGFVSIQKVLKELQRRQLEVTKRLHGADTRSKDELKKEWPIARMHQNTNVEEAKKLEGQLSLLAPRSAERLGVAMQAMQLTLQNGESEEFVQAESFADLASRLLHETSKLAQQEQQNKKRPYRKDSDKYYGRTIIGGDINFEHEYKVDPHYREEVLDEVIKSDYQGDNKIILNNFLKRIIR
jgi:hypothetical protein